MSFDPTVFQGQRAGAWGKRLIVLPETDSTQRVALDLGDAGASTGDTVLALSQTAGRGRWGRAWVAQAGQSLLFSVILRPKAPRRHWGALNVYFGSGVCSSIRALGVSAAQVKWPNDVWVGEQKVAGILAEVRDDMLVLGVGINVTQTPEDWPQELSKSVTSIAAQGTRTNLERVLAQTLVGLEQVLTLFDAGELSLLARAWETQALWMDQELHLSVGKGGVTGRARGLEPSSGGLRLCLPDGQERVFIAGEVTRLRPQGPA